MIIHLEDGKGPVRLLSGQDGAEILDLVVLWMQLTSQGSYLLVSDSTLVLTPTSRLIPWFSTQLHEHRTVSSLHSCNGLDFIPVPGLGPAQRPHIGYPLSSYPGSAVSPDLHQQHL